MKRTLCLLLTFVLLLGSVPFAAFPASAAEENTVSWNTYATVLPGFKGAMTETFDSGYRFENTGHNNISISSATAKNFTFEADVSLVDGNTATLLFGAGENDYSAVVDRTTQCFGLQFQKLDNNINITLFEWGGALGGSIIANTTVTTTTMSNFHIKVAHSDANSLEIWVNDVKANFTFAKNFAGAYKGGYIGLMSFKSVVKFENIVFTPEDGTAITNTLPNLKYADGMVSVIQGCRMKYHSGGNNYSSSTVRGKYFTLESVVNIESGDRASVIFGASSPTYTDLWTTTHNWFGIEFRKFTTDNSIRIKVFNSGGTNAYKVGEIVAQTTVTTTTESDFRIKVSYTLANGLEIWVNDVKATLTFKQDLDDAYGGGYFGFLSYVSGATFTNILLKTADEIRITCVGDSITQGYGVTTKGTNSYPAWLQKTLGEGYSVKNSGVGGASATEDTSKPYVEQTRYADGKQHNPDIVIMMLGTNDGNPSYVWNTADNAGSLAAFKEGYQALVDAYQAAGVNTIFLALPPYSKGAAQQTILETYIIPAIKEIAATESLAVIDMNAFTKGQSTWYCDNVHMNETGYEAIGKKFANYITDYFEATNLAGLELQSDGVTITPVFDRDVNIYGMDIAGGIDTVTLKPIKENADQRIYYTLKNREYKEVTKVKTEVTDTIVLTKEDFEDNYVNMDLTVVSPGGAERTYTFRINKWFTTEELSAQPYRSQFHITPQINFMNDPNGLVYDSTDGYWHVHYQYSPQNSMGQQSWAHVRSKDLVNWEQMPLAMQVDDLGRIYSGSAISLTEEEAADPNIYEGIFADNKEGESRLIAFYTNAGVDGKQRQCTAYSKDHGLTWTKYNDGKPIIDNDQSISGGKFGDPKVFKIPGDDTHWYMVTIGKAQMFASSDLIHWEKVQTLKYRDSDSYSDATDGIIISECPGMNPVTLEGTDEVKWIYSASDTFYVVGNMVKNEETGYYNWVAESARIPNDCNYALYNVSGQPKTYGKYAGMTFYEDGTGKGRTIGISWLKGDAANIDGKLYVGMQSLPYEWKLKKNSTGDYVVINEPIEEIDQLHGEVLFSAENKTVSPTDENILKDTAARLFDLEAVIDVGDADRFGFVVRKGAGQEIVLSYDVATEKMTLDISKVTHKRFEGIWPESAELQNGKIKLRLIVDQGVVEAFGNDGEAGISAVAVTENDKIGMEFFVEGGSVAVESLTIYDMKSMYSGKTDSEVNGTTYVIDTPAYVDYGADFTAQYYIYPAATVNAVWKVEGAEIVSENGNELVLFVTDPEKVTLTLMDGETVLTTKTVKVGSFNTNIPDWKELHGTWEMTDAGMRGTYWGAGNEAYASAAQIPAGTAFTYEADMALEGRSGALVFGFTNPDDPTKDAFAVNIDRDVGVMRVWQFGGNVKDYALSEAVLEQESYHIKVEYDGIATLTYYLDGKQCHQWNVNQLSKTLTALPAGGVGVMAHYGAPTFNNVYLYTEGTDVSVAAFEGIEVEEKSPLDVLLAKLPQTAIVTQSDGIQRAEKITWSTDDLSTQAAGEITLDGAVANSALPVSVKINVVHKWEDDYTVDTSATCGAAGSKSIHCELCDAKKQDSITPIPATNNHTASEEVTTVIPATCGADGVGKKLCTVCGKDAETGVIIPATGAHEGGKATCTEQAVCATCNKPYGEAAGHTAGAWNTVIKATYAKEGLQEQHCTVCDELLDTKTIAKTKGVDTLTIFKDIKKNDWFVKNGSIDYAYNMGFFKGATSTTFEPNTSVTRGMFVTVLGRLHGVKEVKATTQFSDVKKSAYYSGFVAWAAKNGVVTGTSATTFEPEASVTREQICAMMYRYCDYAGIELQKINPKITFADANKISGYAKTAVAACQRGAIVNGKENNKFDPNGNATRAEVATILMNFCENYK